MKNPVYNREMKVSARSIRMPLILAVFNLVLAVFALASMLTALNQARENMQINYAAFLEIFRYVAIIEFALVLFVMPALTSSSISGEREQRTLDLMLTTKLTPARIVIGKMLSSLSNVVVVLVSSLPILALVFTYGGVTLIDLILLMVSYVTVAILAASIGIWASSLSHRSSSATALSYAVLLVLVGGTAGISVLVYNLTGSANGWFYLLLANPASTFYAIINAMTGEREALAMIAENLGMQLNISAGMWFAMGTVVQLIISFVLILFSIRNIGPKRKV